MVAGFDRMVDGGNHVPGDRIASIRTDNLGRSTVHSFVNGDASGALAGAVFTRPDAGDSNPMSVCRDAPTRERDLLLVDGAARQAIRDVIFLLVIRRLLARLP